MSNPQKLQEEIEITDQTIFSIDAIFLNEMFQPDSIRDKVSEQKLKKIGGLPGIATGLQTDLNDGISISNHEEVSVREEVFGKNTPIVVPPQTLWEMICECFEDLMLRILVVASIFSTVAGVLDEGIATGWMEGATIVLAVILIVSVSAGNNYAKEKQFQKLSEKCAEVKVTVTREAKILEIDIKELLVGDILHLNIGDLLSCDGILVEGSQVMMDESAMTGESDLIKKMPAVAIMQGKASAFIISGSQVMDGSGKILVCAVGQNSQMGQLRKNMQEESPPTPLQGKLETIAEDIGTLGIYAAGLTVLALFVHLGIACGKGEVVFLSAATLQAVIKAFLTGVTIVVVAVPEGLPLAVTIALAFSVNKMKDENNLVKNLASCEIMGGATTICTDKTGTLTQNKMTVTSIYIGDKIFSQEKLRKELVGLKEAELFAEAVCVNSNANPIKDTYNGQWDQRGNQTECALVALADLWGMEYHQVRPSQRILRILPFSSSRKKMTTIYQSKDQQTIRVYVKGATEVILERCENIFSTFGNQAIDPAQKRDILDSIIQTFAKESLRTLGIAYKQLAFDGNVNDLTEEFLQTKLTLIAIAGIKDPLRPEIINAIQVGKTAGIKTRMCTGDNIDTATAIAKECGILPPDYQPSSHESYQVMEGKKFREMVGGIIYQNPFGQTPEEKGESLVQNFEQFQSIARQLCVLARSSPEDKFVLVTGLKQMDEVVAVTGDGTNDAPALKKADVGFAMGITGTEVSQDAAGIILLDDNFASILTACQWGRNVYNSIRQFIQFQLTVNIVALFMSFVGSVVLKESPLNSIQMLWVNIIMDTFASLALATEPPTDDLLKKKPYGQQQSIVTPNMWRNVVGQALYQLVVLFILLFKVPEIFNIPSSFGMRKYVPEKAVHLTIFFQAFVLMQVFNEFNARKLERSEVNIFQGLCNNWMFWFIIAVTFIVQFLLVQFGGAAVQISALTVPQHVFCLVIGFGSLIVGLLIKLLPECLFNQIKLFREETMDARSMKRSLTSLIRKDASTRLSIGSNAARRESVLTVQRNQSMNRTLSQQKPSQELMQKAESIDGIQ